MKNSLPWTIPTDARRYLITAEAEWGKPWTIPESFECPVIPLSTEVHDHAVNECFSGTLYVTRPDSQPAGRVGLLITTPLAEPSPAGRTLDRVLWSGHRTVVFSVRHPALRLRRSCVPVTIIDLYWPDNVIRAVLRKSCGGSAALAIPATPSRPLEEARRLRTELTAA